MTHTADDFLVNASCLMAQRGQQYDRPEGERSMDRMREGGIAIAFSWDSYRGQA